MTRFLPKDLPKFDPAFLYHGDDDDEEDVDAVVRRYKAMAGNILRPADDMEVLRRYAAAAGNPGAVSPEAFAAIQDTAEHKAKVAAADGDRAERRAARSLRRNKSLNWISSMVPPWARRFFRGVGVLAVANYILTRVKKTGISDAYYGSIAAVCGVCKKTVQRAVAILAAVGLNVRRGAYDRSTGKNEPTVISVANGKLRDWISRGIGGGGQQSPASSNIDRSLLTYYRPVNERLQKWLPRRRKPPD